MKNCAEIFQETYLTKKYHFFIMERKTGLQKPCPLSPSGSVATTKYPQIQENLVKKDRGTQRRTPLLPYILTKLNWLVNMQE